jgi:uncharacterized protein YyaL (SSP411 family)
MKKFTIYTLIALLGVLTSFKPNKHKEKEIVWYDWNEGYEIAHKKNKILLVDVYTNWCGWCKRMDHDTYENSDVRDQINKDFVAVKLNPELQGKVYKVDTLSLNGFQLLDVLTNYQRSGYPTIIFVNPKVNQVMYLSAGYQDAGQFKQTLTSVVATKNKKAD